MVSAGSNDGGLINGDNGSIGVRDEATEGSREAIGVLLEVGGAVGAEASGSAVGVGVGGGGEGAGGQEKKGNLRT